MYNKLRTYKYKNVQYSKWYLTNQCFINRDSTRTKNKIKYCTCD